MESQQDLAMLDILIKNGFIIDGSGDPGYMRDIGVRGDRIVLGAELDGAAGRIINAEGMAISPGFIDIHAHTDHLVYINQTCESKATQGVTTEVSGNCGESAAPRGGLHCDEAMCDWGPDHGIVPDWRTMGEFLNKLDHLPMSINFATYAGHGAIRGVAMGYVDREPAADEMALMCSLLAEAMDAGAFGLSSGLIYPPGCYSKASELTELCKVAAGYNGIYSTHIRNEGVKLLDAVGEAIEIGAKSGASVQLAHHKACGNRARGKVNESLAMIDDARARGLDVWADQYPYEATCTGLGSILPDWAHDGGTAALLRRLSDPYERGLIRDYLLKESEPCGRIGDTGGWRSIAVSQIYGEKNRRHEGRSIEEIAAMMEKRPEDAVLDLLSDEKGNVGIIHFMIDEHDIRAVMRHPAVLIGSDATARSRTGILSGGKPHPRAYGTFPRVLGKYVREEGLLSLEEAIAKMTGRTANRLGLRKRGLIRDGYFADLVIFDPAKIADAATYEHPHQPSMGISHVFVNGKSIVDEGALVGIGDSGPGRVLRRCVE